MLEMILGAWVAQGIAAAAQLGVADALADGPLRAEELARRVDANPDTLDRLMRALVSEGVFRRTRRRPLRAERAGRHVAHRTPRSRSRRMAKFVGSPQHREHWSHLAEAVRTGEAVIPKLRGKEPFDYIGSEPELGGDLQRRHDQHLRACASPPWWPPMTSPGSAPSPMSAAGTAGCWPPY